MRDPKQGMKMLQNVFTILQQMLRPPASARSRSTRTASQISLTRSNSNSSSAGGIISRLNLLRSKPYRQHRKVEAELAKYQAAITQRKQNVETVSRRTKLRLAHKLRAEEAAARSQLSQYSITTVNRSHLSSTANHEMGIKCMTQMLHRKASQKRMRDLLVEQLEAQIRFFIDASGEVLLSQSMDDENKRQHCNSLPSMLQNKFIVRSCSQDEQPTTSSLNAQNGLVRCMRVHADSLCSHQGMINDLSFNHAETLLASCGTDDLVKASDRQV